MKLPTPHQLGLPEHYSGWRPVQEQMVNVIVSDTRRVSMICGPTGSGKTLAIMGGAILSGKPTCIVTDNKGLQDQAVDEFGACGLVDLRGRSNYQCGMRPDWSCEEGAAARCPYKGTMVCPNSQAEMRAATSSLVITNYAKWTSAKKFGTGMNHFQQVIFDEGHQAPAALEAAMQVVINQKEVESSLGLDFLTGADSDDMREWKKWAVAARAVAESEMLRAAKRLKDSEIKASHIRHYLHMRNLNRRLGVLSTCNPTDWVADTQEKGYQFDPISAGRYGEMAMLMNIPRIIIISATLRPKTAFMLGIPQRDFSFVEYDSEFDPKRCPTYWIPTLQVNHRVTDMSPVWNRLDQILSRRRDRKGIIHTVSYDRRDEIVANSRFRGSMLFNKRGEPITEALDSYLQAGPGALMVSPSVGMGYDFPMKQCEFQFITKVPFPDGRSKILKARKEVDKEYSMYYTMQKLVQALGRGMRSKADRCENFIVDDSIEWFRRQYSHLAPRSFHLFFKRVEVLPQPPEALR